jgi:hypothetical protein
VQRRWYRGPPLDPSMSQLQFTYLVLQFCSNVLASWFWVFIISLTYCLGYNWAPCFWGIWIRGPGPPGWGSLESETVKCGRKSRGTRTSEWLRWRGPAATVNDRPILSSERILRKDYDSKCLVENKRILVVILKWLVVKISGLEANRQSGSNSALLMFPNIDICSYWSRRDILATETLAV